MRNWREQRIALFFAFTAIAVSGPFAYATQEVAIQTVSSRSDTVSGGNVLVQLNAASNLNWAVYLKQRDVTPLFSPSERSGKLLALLTGLKIGENTLEVRVDGAPRTRLQIVNHSLAGPIFSGPHQQPFICQTEANGLGPPLDADCNAKTVVHYYYKSTEPLQMSMRDRLIADYDTLSRDQFETLSRPIAPPLGFKLYDPAGPLPPDVAKIILPDGHVVNYTVRREIGVINRAVYEIQFLHEPSELLPTPWSRPHLGWNGRLVYAFGGGCGTGYRQGVLAGDKRTVLPVSDRKAMQALLSQGYAVATSTLNVLGITCNDKVSAETASMVKEYFIKEYGEPTYTIGLGASGGAVSVYLIAQNYPGILDGIIAFFSAPDIVTTVIPAFSDCALLSHALRESKHSWTDVQKTAISGYATWRACATADVALSSFGWLDPKKCHSSLPKETIYNRVSNPKGTRCTFYDNEVNVFGFDPKTGFARSTLDNVGIQYGLVAFNAGVIDAEQFIELNERVGGYSQDGEILSTRTVADPEAIRAAYQYGVAVSGKSLADIPIIDWNRYLDDLGDTHTRDRAFLTRSRLIAANGDADNQVILVTPRPTYDGWLISDVRDESGVGLPTLVSAMDRWLANIAADRQDIALHAKIVRNRPADIADGCIGVDGERIFEPAIYDAPGKCNQMYPSHGNPRVAAGAPIAGDILKCELKPIDMSDYSKRLTNGQMERLKNIFSVGVCDYSRPAIGHQVAPILWHVYGNSTK